MYARYIFNNKTIRHLIILMLLLPTQTRADITLKCNWTIISSWKIKLLPKEGKNNKPVLYKSVHSTSPGNCVTFNIESPLPGKISKESVPTLFETYQFPQSIHLTCPKGYQSASEITWGQTGGVARKSNAKTYYLDFFQAELPCIKDN